MVPDFKDAIVIAGPTASGKTGFSVELAKTVNGAVINADSMQIYDILQILTARPSIQGMEGVPHYLFGHVSPRIAYSAAKWIEDAETALNQVRASGKVPIFVGGTGLYFKVLIEGLSSIPQIEPQIREKWRKRSRQWDSSQLYDKLKKLDPQGADKLQPGDTQRLVRALEVVEGTGKPISFWQNDVGKSPLLDGAKCKKLILMPPREILRSRINSRFKQMLDKGALLEVEQLNLLGLSSSFPAMRAIGVSQLSQYRAGKITLDEACELACAATRQYAKRQSTWFRNQFSDWYTVADRDAGIQFALANG